MEKLKHHNLTSNIINSALKVHNTLGYGFLEKVYHKALYIEITNRGMKAESEKSIIVNCKRRSKIVPSGGAIMYHPLTI